MIEMIQPDTTHIDPAHRPALIDLLYQLADDELLTGHRNSEWLGVAPDIEEDVAFASIAQDEVGHATFFYGLLAQLGVGSEDALAFARPSSARRNAQFVERQNGDWAHTIVRQLFYDAFEQVRLEALSRSTFTPLALVAAKMLREEQYHLLHMETWFRMLALGGHASRSRLEAALIELSVTAVDLFHPGLYEDVLVSSGMFPVSGAELYATWSNRLHTFFSEVGLSWHPHPPTNNTNDSGRMGAHTSDLDALLTTMGEVYRLDPTTSW